MVWQLWITLYINYMRQCQSYTINDLSREEVWLLEELIRRDYLTTTLINRLCRRYQLIISQKPPSEIREGDWIDIDRVANIEKCRKDLNYCYWSDDSWELSGLFFWVINNSYGQDLNLMVERRLIDGKIQIRWIY